jgi:hypothetical protein
LFDASVKKLLIQPQLHRRKLGEQNGWQIRKPLKGASKMNVKPNSTKREQRRKLIKRLDLKGYGSRKLNERNWKRNVKSKRPSGRLSPLPRIDPYR